MKHLNAEAMDQAIKQLLQQWYPKIGAPSCGAACSRCCETTTLVICTSEAIRLLDFLDQEQPFLHSDVFAELDARMQRVREQLLSSEVNPSPSQRSPSKILVSQGSCVFLKDQCCSVYPARPDTCRTFHVWHSSGYCGQAHYDMCSPAELGALRSENLFSMMLNEVAEKRIPFWGHFQVMIWLMAQYRDAYMAGEFVAPLLDSLWLESGLVQFYDCGKDLQGLEQQLQTALQEHCELVKNNLMPFGQPKVADCQSRDDLAAHPIDVKWLMERGR